MNKLNTILLTGSNGFIGSNIYSALLQNSKYNILTINRGNHINSLVYEKKMIIGNFYDPLILDRISEKIDIIIHCAAIRGETNLPYSEYKKVNVLGTETLLKFAKKHNIRRFIYISSVGVLGTIPAIQPASNKNPSNPDGKYHQSKWQAEELVRAYHTNGLQTIILRPTITYGPGDDGFVSKLVSLIKKRKFIFPKGNIYIHLLDVGAFSELIVNIMEKDLYDGKTSIIADKKAIRLKTLVDGISNAFLHIPYPLYYQYPGFIFSIMKNIISLLNMKQLLTSIKLISENWTYDIDDTKLYLQYHPKDTYKVMEQYKIVNKG